VSERTRMTVEYTVEDSPVVTAINGVIATLDGLSPEQKMAVLNCVQEIARVDIPKEITQ